MLVVLSRGACDTEHVPTFAALLPQVTVHVSSEFTTMAGRRLREAVYATVKQAWGAGVKVRSNGSATGTRDPPAPAAANCIA
jgi:hypothetical protein